MNRQSDGTRRLSTVIADDRDSETARLGSLMFPMVICSIQPLEKCDYKLLLLALRKSASQDSHRFGREVFSPHFTWWHTIRIDPLRIGFVCSVQVLHANG